MRLSVMIPCVLLGVLAQYGIGAAAPNDLPGEPTFGPAPAHLPTGSSGELARLNAEILRHPQDTALNLRYAAVAEERGELRLALTAYERILIYDPQNTAALEGIWRMRKGIQPATTQWMVGVGAIYESNSTYAAKGMETPEGEAFGWLNVRDDRTVAGTRWRTDGNVTGTLHGDQTQLDYGYAGATTGPLYELMPGISVHPAIGAGASFFDQSFFYGEGIASLGFESYPNGAYEAVTLRAALRDYDTFFVPEHTGGYFDVTGKFTIPLDNSRVALNVVPWLRWSSIKGPIGVVTPGLGVQPGDYTEVGGQLNGFVSLWNPYDASTLRTSPSMPTKAPVSIGTGGFMQEVILGANIAVSERYYRDEPVSVGTGQRRDFTVAPGASLILPHLLQYQNTLRIDYTYLHDNSNDATRSFVDNVVMVTLIRGF
jgi:hypothetical protein